MTKSFEERFDEWKSKYPTGNDLADVVGVSDDMFVSISDLEAFIRQEKELSRREERDRILNIANEMTDSIPDNDDDYHQGKFDGIQDLIQKINQVITREDK